MPFRLFRHYFAISLSLRFDDAFIADFIFDITATFIASIAAITLSPPFHARCRRAARSDACCLPLLLPLIFIIFTLDAFTMMLP
jgi:hypothetical protein